MVELAQSQDTTDKKEEDEGSEEEADDMEDEIEYEVYYNSSDIKQTLLNQDHNLFTDLVSVTREVLQENSGRDGL